MNFKKYALFGLSIFIFIISFSNSGICQNQLETEMLNGLLDLDQLSDRDQFGYSIDIDEGRAIIGAWGDDDHGSNSGAAYILDQSRSGEWTLTQKITLPDGEAGDLFGWKVLLEGNRALVSAIGELGKGAVYFYRFNGESWVNDLRLIAPDGLMGDRFGSAIAKNEFSILIGAEGVDDLGTSAGAVYAYTFVESEENNMENWIYNRKIMPDNLSAKAFFGSSISVFGNRIAIGAYGSDSYVGKVYIYERGLQQTAELKLPENIKRGGDGFGSSVSLTKDRILIGAYGRDDFENNSGSAYIFNYENEEWSDPIRLNAPDASKYDYFGISVKIRGDRAIVGSYRSDVGQFKDKGAAYYFELQNDQWNFISKFSSTDELSNQYFGLSMDMDSNQLMIGAPGKNLSRGGIYLYQFDQTRWSLVQTIANSDNRLRDSFGEAFHVDGNQLIAGVSQRERAYIFEYDEVESMWEEVTILTPHEPSPFGNNTRFGTSVYIHENQCIVGEPSRSSGAAQVFRFSDNQWGYEDTLLPNDGPENDRFGLEVIIHDNVAMVSDPYRDGNEGKVYLFKYDDLENTWERRNTILPSNRGFFGMPMRYKNEKLLVGAKGESIFEPFLGVTYVYNIGEGNTGYGLPRRLIPNDAGDNDLVGSAFDVEGEFLAVGSPRSRSEDDRMRGAVSIFKYDEQTGGWREVQKLFPRNHFNVTNFGEYISMSGNQLYIGGDDEINGSRRSIGYLFQYDELLNKWIEISSQKPDNENDFLKFSGKSIVTENRAIVGSPSSDNGRGRIYVFEKR